MPVTSMNKASSPARTSPISRLLMIGGKDNACCFASLRKGSAILACENPAELQTLWDEPSASHSVIAVSIPKGVNVPRRA